MKLNLRGFILFLGITSAAAQIPQPIFPEGVGVNIHFVTGHERDLDLIAAAGFKFIRMDFAWTSIEKQKGLYDWSEYETLLANLEKRGIRPIFILDYSHPLYEETVSSPNPLTHQVHKTTASPQHPESIAAFARWAAAAAKHFHGRAILWEIWNEPNIQFWSPKPDATQYTALALETCKAIRAAEPQATIIGPASSGFPWDFLETFLQSGVLDYLDAVSIHPYRDARRPPETASADFEKLRQLIRLHAPVQKANIPILSGEWGYSSHRKGVTLETQAAFAARQQLSNLLEGAPLSIWYDWKNDGSDPNENEHNFGTVLPDLAPKPAYSAIQTLTRQLAGCRISRRLPLDNPKDYVVLCVNPAGQQRLAAWTLGEAHSVNIALVSGGKQTPEAVNLSGDAVALTVESSQVGLPLTAGPLYVNLGSNRVK